MKEKAANLFGRVGGCVIVGGILGMIFGMPGYMVESIGAPILVLLLLEFTSFRYQCRRDSWFATAGAWVWKCGTCSSSCREDATG